MMTRREALQKTTLAAAACATAAATVSCVHGQHSSTAEVAPTGPFTLPTLPYKFDALEPYIDTKTMEIHYSKHHQAYVNNLNKAVAGQSELAGKSVDELVGNLSAVPEAVRPAVRNNGGGHYNHSLFWQTLRRYRDGKPKGALADAFKQKFGGYKEFKTQFADAALKVFGSGWAWLTLDNKELRIETTVNQDCPLSESRAPLLGIDVWEHAYYLTYQNRRGDYIASFYNVINWDFVGKRYEQLLLVA
jgi:Fe-Mn family superoxide dismutase